MYRVPVKYHSLSREQLHEELAKCCRRLRNISHARGQRRAAAEAAAPRAVRCLMTKERSDSDLPWLIEAERRAHVLLTALHDVAALLGRLDNPNGGRGGGNRLPS